MGAALLVALAVNPATAAGERMLVTPGSGRHLSAAIVTRARDALLGALGARCPSCLLVPLPGPPQETPLDPASAAALATQFDGQVILALDLEHHAGLTTFSLVEHRPRRAGNSLPPRVFVESTRAGPDVVEPLIHRLVGRLFQAFPEPAPLAETPAVPRRLFVGFGAGMLVQLGTAARKDQLLANLALSGTRVGPSSLLDLRLDFAWNGLARRSAAGVAYSFRFGEAWSLGLASTWVWMNLGGRGASGVAVEPIVGYRVVGTPVRIEAGYSLNLFKEQVADRLIPGSDATTWSHGPRLLVGVLL